ncbi:MAG TPA: SdrD B-like domain-containing protein [Pseudonocardiaceae bacterium]
MRRLISSLVVLCLGTAPVLLSGTAFADVAPAGSGGAICGTVWRDVNNDGIHQATEPVMPYVAIDISPEMSVNTDDNGHYCFSGLAAGTYTVQANDLARHGGFGWTLPGHDSKVDWTTGRTKPITITADQHVDSIDIGYVKSTDDLKPVQLLIDIRGETRYASDQHWPSTPFQVGDILTLFGSVEIDGNVADQLGATLTVPDGMTILKTAGGMPSSIANSHQVVGKFPGLRFPNDLEFVGATVRVDKPFDQGKLTVEAFPGELDANKDNNTLTRTLSAVAAPPRSSQPSYPTETETYPTHAAASPGGPTDVATTATTKQLAYTGASPWVPLAIGAALLLAGAGALVLARRRKRVRG